MSLAKTLVFLIFLGLFFNADLSAQIVDIESPNQGVTFPRVTTTANVSAPAEGMVVYQTSVPEGLYQYDGASWSIIGGGGGASPEYFLMRGWISGASSERWTFLASGFNGAELFAQHIIPFSGKLSNLVIKPISALPLGAVAVFTVRVNGDDTGLQLSFNNADGIALKEDLDEVTVNKGDRVAIRMQETGGVDPMSTYFGISVQLKP